MADYTIDKIHYGSDTYLLKDSDAIHEINGEVNINKLNTNYIKNTGTIYSNTIDTQYLTVRENANIQSATIDDLIATKARVVATLDIDGEMHTKSWTNSNIAHIGGNFYISPDITSTATEMQLKISNIAQAFTQGYTLTAMNGDFRSHLLIGDGENGETDFIMQDWVVGSKVMMTGTVFVGNIEYPLGTCVGILSTPIQANYEESNGSNQSGNPTSFTMQRVKNTVIDELVNKYGNNNEDLIIQALEIKVALYSLGTGTILDSSIVAGYKPIGIMMTSYGIDSKSYIDIYGGTIPTDEFNEVEPVVRIGLLNGLPNLSSDNNSATQPKGWGIYTSNGYFKGRIIASAGLIGGFAIDEEKLSYKNINEVKNQNEQGAYLGPNGFNISGGSYDNTTYFTEDEVLIGGVFHWREKEYIQTEDITPDPNKTYYYINNNNEYVIFTGNSFSSGVIYYELTSSHNLHILANEIIMKDGEAQLSIKANLKQAMGDNINQYNLIQNNSYAITDINNILNTYIPFIEAKPNEASPYIDLQLKDDTNYYPKLHINRNEISFSLDEDNNIITKISNNLMHTSFGEFENLRMRMGNTGNLTWIARSNGHLSLKVVE